MRDRLTPRAGEFTCDGERVAFQLAGEAVPDASTDALPAVARLLVVVDEAVQADEAFTLVVALLARRAHVSVLAMPQQGGMLGPQMTTLLRHLAWNDATVIGLGPRASIALNTVRDQLTVTTMTIAQPDLSLPARVVSQVERQCALSVIRDDQPAYTIESDPVATADQSHEYRTGSAVDVDVLIVGSGFAGLGMGIRLAREARSVSGTAAPAPSFLIIERASDVGGTWRDNTYPGVACDIPSHLYSFSFRPNPGWSRVFSPGAEIEQYLRDSAREEGLLPHIRFGTELRGAEWDAASKRWFVQTSTGRIRARSLVMAVGRLSEPSMPDIDGLATFTGPAFHSSRFDHDLDLTGLRVGLVGTGASAVQLTPHLAAKARELVVFQRSAPWVVPRDDRAFTDDEKHTFATDPGAIATVRDEIFWRAEEALGQRLGITASIDRHRMLARRHLETQVADPALRALLTPDYEIGCKRVLISSDYYPALTQSGVMVEGSALASVDGGTAVAASGHRYALDVLVFATGFETSRPPYARLVTGADGVRLDDHWAETGMTAFASTIVSGFPNLFIIDGPNASLGHNSAIGMIETQVEYALGALAHLRRHPQSVVDVPAAAEADYTREIDRMAASTVWLGGGCSSWYVDPRAARLTLLWPDFAHTFRERNGTFDPSFGRERAYSVC